MKYDQRYSTTRQQSLEPGVYVFMYSIYLFSLPPAGLPPLTGEVIRVTELQIFPLSTDVTVLSMWPDRLNPVSASVRDQHMCANLCHRRVESLRAFRTGRPRPPCRSTEGSRAAQRWSNCCPTVYRHFFSPPWFSSSAQQRSSAVQPRQFSHGSSATAVRFRATHTIHLAPQAIPSAL